MALPDPTIEAAKAVFQVSEPTQRRPDQDEAFLKAVYDEFPSVASRQYVTPESPPMMPHLIVQSTASRVALSAVGCEFDTRFYGDYRTDRDRCFEYIERKLRALLAGWDAIGATPSFLGLVVIAHFSFQEAGQDTTPARYVTEHHLRTEVDLEQLQDAAVRIGLRLEERYFLTLTIANYEIRGLERAMFPGQQLIQVRPWEGTVEDFGVELTLDVNNRLEALIIEQDPEVTGEGMKAMVELAQRVMSRSDQVVETGRLDEATLTAEQS